MGSLVLLDLMGGVALLLWGLHMVHSGILRAFGPDLRSLLAKALKNRFAAFAAGIGLTALLQSSTATALITSSFTADGLVSLVPALASSRSSEDVARMKTRVRARLRQDSAGSISYAASVNAIRGRVPA